MPDNAWKDKIKKDEVRSRTGLQRVETILRERKLRWLGHVMRMDSERIPHQGMNWQLAAFKRRQGRPRKNWTDIVVDTAIGYYLQT